MTEREVINKLKELHSSNSKVDKLSKEDIEKKKNRK